MKTLVSFINEAKTSKLNKNELLSKIKSQLSSSSFSTTVLYSVRTAFGTGTVVGAEVNLIKFEKTGEIYFLFNAEKETDALSNFAKSVNSSLEFKGGRIKMCYVKVAENIKDIEAGIDALSSNMKAFVFAENVHYVTMNQADAFAYKDSKEVNDTLDLDDRIKDIEAQIKELEQEKSKLEDMKEILSRD